jgi:hypothetical protein
MKNITARHVDAIVHCRILIQPALNRFKDQATKRLIEHDMQLLDEVRDFLNYQLVSPKLPFGDVPDGNPDG